ncbi:hypothetical protein CTI12_AA145820 [Artemisia annua]|uniref:CCHC-type domain-containing protein n=1 Tax=Artemisia annua TaxID=35608 RepID=A0A2U1PIT5_ARTAN|nr:hypothetical protein CTI12_AA145820 [Artemisia annua]
MKEIADSENEGKKRLQTEDDLDQAELAQFEADIRAKNLILYGLSNDIYNAIDSNLTAHDLWKALERLMQGADVGTQTQQTLALWNYQSFKQLPEESLEDAYIRFNKLINEMNRQNLKRSNIEHNTLFLTNLQPEWRRFTIAIKQNQDLTAKDINNLFDLLKHNQVEDQASVELTQIVQNLALLGKHIQKTFYKHTTNNNLRITSAPTAMRQGVQKNKKNDGGQDNQDPKCFGCGQQGYFAKNCPNWKVHNKAYYRHKMLLADIEEKAQEEDATPSYDTDAEDDDTLINKVHTSDACDYDALDELIHGHPRTINKSIAVTTHKSTSLEKKIKDMLYEEKSERPLILKRQIQYLQNENFHFKRNISQVEKSKKNLETEVSTLKEEKAYCIKRLAKAETKLRTDHQTTQTMHMLLPKPDPLLDLKLGIGYTQPSYLDIVKRQTPSLYNADYMRRDTFKDYMFVPNDISQEEI